MLRTIARLVPRPLPTANITPAAMFRVVEAAKPSLLIDEADSFAHENEELRGVVNSSHCGLDAFVVRAVPVGDDYEARRFSTWAPMAIASIGKVAATIADRSVMIPMERKAPGQTVARMRVDHDHGFVVLASKAARWVADTPQTLRDLDPDVPPALNDRQADNWRPLLAIADLAGGDWPAPRPRRSARASAPPTRTPRPSAFSCSPNQGACSTRRHRGDLDRGPCCSGCTPWSSALVRVRAPAQADLAAPAGAPAEAVRHQDETDREAGWLDGHEQKRL